MLNSLRPDILEHEPLLVVNSNNNIMHYAFSITETLFCSRTTPLFKLSLRPVLSVISASPSRVLVLRLSRTIYTPFPPSSRRMQLRTILSRNSLHSRAGERDNWFWVRPLDSAAPPFKTKINEIFRFASSFFAHPFCPPPSRNRAVAARLSPLSNIVVSKYGGKGAHLRTSEITRLMHSSPAKTIIWLEVARWNSWTARKNGVEARINVHRPTPMKRDSLNSQVREGGRGSSFNGVIASHDAPPETFSGNFSPDYSIAVSLCNERRRKRGRRRIFVQTILHSPARSGKRWSLSDIAGNKRVRYPRVPFRA